VLNQDDRQGTHSRTASSLAPAILVIDNNAATLRVTARLSDLSGLRSLA
jgi:hypothetical protein